MNEHQTIRFYFIFLFFFVYFNINLFICVWKCVVLYLCVCVFICVDIELLFGNDCFYIILMCGVAVISVGLFTI